MTPARIERAEGTAGSLVLMISLLVGLDTPYISAGEIETAMRSASAVQIDAAKRPVAQGNEEARWLAVRYAAEAEHHYLEAIRYEERAIRIDPAKDSRGTNRNTLLSAADFHWTRMLDLRTRAQLFRVEADQHSLR